MPYICDPIGKRIEDRDTSIIGVRFVSRALQRGRSKRQRKES